MDEELVMSSVSKVNNYINVTDHNALRGHAVVDLARSYGKSEGSGDVFMARLAAEKIVGIYFNQIAMPVSDAWSKLPKLSSLVDAAKEGFLLASSYEQVPSTVGFEKALRHGFEQAIPCLRELSINPTIQSDTLQTLASALMANRDEAVENVKVSGDGLLGALTRRIAGRKADELHGTYLTNVSDTSLAGALSLTACQLCQVARNSSGISSTQFDEIEILKVLGERIAPANAHATLSRLSDVAHFLNEQNTSSYKVA
jgi:hypothetical protein